MKEMPYFYYSPTIVYNEHGLVKIWDENATFFEEQTNEFHLSEADKKIICKKCGAKEFTVGKGLYFTMIRCNNCRWEQCIHEG